MAQGKNQQSGLAIQKELGSRPHPSRIVADGTGQHNDRVDRLIGLAGFELEKSFTA
jgi:hypothetical protein